MKLTINPERKTGKTKMKKQLAEAIKDAGSADILACKQLNSFVLEITKRYGCTEQQAISLGLLYRCSNSKIIDNDLED